MTKPAKKHLPLYNVDELIPPEGVPLRLQVAGVGVRIAAQLTDLVITLLTAIAIVILLGMSGMTEPVTWMAVASMLFFITRVPYYVLSEIIWNGQTLGKRLMKIKVVEKNGRSLTVHSLVVRNMLKEAEVFLPGTLLFTLDAGSPLISLIAACWVMGTLLVPLLNKRRRRLGDFVAGTYVVHLPEPILLSDISRAKREKPKDADEFTFLSHQLDHYGAFELQTLEDLLRKQSQPMGSDATYRHSVTQTKIVENIRRKIGFAKPVSFADQKKFLQAFYNAQRAYLEQRQLFGERRQDKFHADETTKDGAPNP